ncbi:MAG: type I DNA topoisomerase [Acidobacteriota bacterium]
MTKSLVVVESPAKAKTISKYLGNNFIVKASVGHIKDLPKSKLGVDVEEDFKPDYAIIPGKAKVVKELRSAAKGIKDIYLAADPDREGEAICQHLFEELSGKSRNIYRVLFHEITKNAIHEAFKNPGRINQNKVDAQLTRRVLDRLVGYKISPLLWDKVRRGLSAGRVQTVALRMIVEREQEIRAFTSEEYWTLSAKLAAKLPPEFMAKARQINGKKWDISDADTTNAIVENLKQTPFVVQKVHRREKKKYPVPPFITSKLQQDAARRLNFSVKRTMILAQRLYEGIEIGQEGSIGLITYMRTDSSRVSESALKEVRDLIGREYGKDYLPNHPIYYKAKNTAQEAHEAIRPTSVERTPDSLKNDLEPDLWRLYSLIWNRFVASQMQPAIFDQTDVAITAGNVEFKAIGSIEKFKGFLAVYKESKPDERSENKNGVEQTVLPELKEGERLKLLELVPAQHFTQPPPRYNEASLVKALEAKGIGRPSTRMEVSLDRIESGRELWKNAMRDFYDRFSKKLIVAKTKMRNVKTESIETDEVCDKCGNKMVIKWGKFGRFMACSTYPECRNTREIVKGGTTEEQETSQIEDIECEKCGRPMIRKRGRFGEFLACSGYPECRNTKKIVKSSQESEVKPDIPLDEECPNCGKKLAVKHGRFGEFTACSNYPDCKYIKLKSTGVPCPEENCNGEIVERKSRRGKVFYGCSNYPDCDFVLWNKPLPESCPLCDARYTVVKTTKRSGTVRYCNKEDCDFKESLES